MSDSDPEAATLPALRARLRETQTLLDTLHLASYNIAFAIAYGAAAEAWLMLDELGRQADELQREVEGLEAEIARLEAEHQEPPPT